MSIGRNKKIANLRRAGLSNAEIGRRLNLSRERVRQLVTGRTTAKIRPSRRDPDALLSAAEAAELLNVHINTVRRWSDNGILEAYRIGPRGDRRLRQREIDNFLMKNARGKHS